MRLWGRRGSPSLGAGPPPQTGRHSVRTRPPARSCAGARVPAAAGARVAGPPAPRAGLLSHPLESESPWVWRPHVWPATRAHGPLSRHRQRNSLGVEPACKEHCRSGRGQVCPWLLLQGKRSFAGSSALDLPVLTRAKEGVTRVASRPLRTAPLQKGVTGVLESTAPSHAGPGTSPGRRERGSLRSLGRAPGGPGPPRAGSPPGKGPPQAGARCPAATSVGTVTQTSGSCAWPASRWRSHDHNATQPWHTRPRPRRLPAEASPPRALLSHDTATRRRQGPARRTSSGREEAPGPVRGTRHTAALGRRGVSTLACAGRGARAVAAARRPRRHAAPFYYITFVRELQQILYPYSKQHALPLGYDTVEVDLINKQDHLKYNP